MKDEEKKPDTVIHLDPALENGVYANAANFIHNPHEFVFDFIFVLPGDRRKVVARVVTAPGHAKQMAEALRGNVARFEASYGEIKAAAVEPARKDLQ